MKKPQYKPYTGGAGPDRELCENNTKALYEILLANPTVLPNKVSLVYKDLERIEVEELFVCIQSNRRRIYIIYDRWGFCDNEGELDQASLDETILWVYRTIF